MRRRVLIIGGVIALLASACGSSTEEQFRASLIEEGISEDQADCIIENLEEAGIDPESLTDEALGDNEPPAEAIEATFACMLDDEFGDMLDDEGLDVGDLLDDADGPNDRGDDPELDRLWDACAGGDGAACDELYFTSPIGSVYEEFGNTCGLRFALDDVPFSCEEEMG